MKSTNVKRSVVIHGQKTSVSLEDAFWDGLKEIAKKRRKTLFEVITKVDDERSHGNLSSALRLFVLAHYKDKGQVDGKDSVENGSNGKGDLADHTPGRDLGGGHIDEQ